MFIHVARTSDRRDFIEQPHPTPHPNIMAVTHIYMLYNDITAFSWCSIVAEGGCNTGVDNIHGRKNGKEGYSMTVGAADLPILNCSLLLSLYPMSSYPLLCQWQKFRRACWCSNHFIKFYLLYIVMQFVKFGLYCISIMKWICLSDSQ